MNSDRIGSLPSLKDLPTRKFHSKPAEDPYVFQPVVRSLLTDKIEISTTYLQTKFSEEHILDTFISNDPSKIDQICKNLTALLQNHESHQTTILNNENIVEAINNSITCINNANLVTSFSMFILSLLENDNTVMVDSGILFGMRDLINNYPDQILNFYHEVPLVSTYARDAIICNGIISDIIDKIKNEQYTTNDTCVKSAHTLLSLFSCSEPIANNVIEPFLPEIIHLLNIGNEKALYYIIHTVINIVRKNHDFVSDIYELKIHEYAAKILPIKSLTRICVHMIVNLGVCETMGIAHLMNAGVIQSLIDLTKNHEVAPSSYWALSNCTESAPSIIIPFIPVELLSDTLALLNSQNIDEITKKECVYFLGTLLLYSPIEKFHIIVSNEILEQIITMLSSSNDSLVCRCLDALGRVLFVGITNEKKKYVISMICSSPELSSHMERISSSDNTILSNKAKTFMSEADKKKKEL
ncbi:hypothetical protein TRFO_34175 [Tritrichomonas foetus]|uniref:Uncharacterized protein n=1 Tax=Tritrichomonas foetus TaxID=1144522 RepID=A0A1J4JJM4_9EUKA|nr:hypothetical protein TRFO_34175 [Tritrichomonas foetus]|eukprot:OHS99366.1 hypothetical protein TRFO_34175 [Tritrichomonas foetus]